MLTLCPNCKHKFDVPKEYIGKQIKCPKCKHSYNFKAPEELCENCGKIIGNLEQACVFDNNIVCQNCYATLTVAKDKKVRATPPQTKQQKPVPQQVTAERKIIVKERTGAKSGNVLVGGWLCLILATLISCGTLGCGACVYIPLWILALLLAVIAMAQGHVLGGIILFIACFALPSIVGLVITGGTGILGYEAIKNLLTSSN